MKNIDKTVHFTGKKYIMIGKNTLISQNTWLNVNKRDNKIRINIGDYCFIGRNNFFTSGELIEFADFVITSVNCCFLGASHDYSNPLKPYYFTSAASSDIIKIGMNVFVSANVTILGNVSIGKGAIIGANSFINNESFPDFSLVVGNPAKIIKRFSFIDNKWKNINLWNEQDENSIINDDEYKNILAKYKIPNNLPLKAIGKSNGDLLD
jgi:acetyltransferase-like isoleucine patch superfamily enzyme